MSRKTKATFNPEALYQVGPKGLWVETVVDISRDPPEETGPIYLLPGAIIGYDEELVK